MAGVTPYYGWPYPTGTDRVMDGDNAMEALARAVENTLSAHVNQQPVFAAATPGLAFAGGGQCRKVGASVHIRVNSTCNGGQWGPYEQVMRVPWPPVEGLYFTGYSMNEAIASPLVVQDDGWVVAQKASAAGGGSGGVVGTVSYIRATIT